jgi:hypothetical protein
VKAAAAKFAGLHGDIPVVEKQWGGAVPAKPVALADDLADAACRH